MSESDAVKSRGRATVPGFVFLQGTGGRETIFLGGDHFKIDKSLIERARQLGGHNTKKAAIICALEEFIRWHEQQKIPEAFGTVDFDPAYDYKAQRSKKRMR